VVALFVTKIVN